MKVRKAEVLLTVIEVFNLIEDFMVDRDGIAVRKGTEEHTHAVGVERERPSTPPQRAYPRAPGSGGGPPSARGERRDQAPPLHGRPHEPVPPHHML